MDLFPPLLRGRGGLGDWLVMLPGWVRAAGITMIVLVSESVTSVGFAGGPIGPDGSRINTSRYGVDPSYYAVMAGTRATGLAGSYVAIAEGTDGNLQNAAAPAVRSAWSVDRLEFDASLSLLLPNSIAGTDFFNTGRGSTDLRRSEPSELAMLSPSAIVQYGPWGIGFNGELQRYGLKKAPADSTGTGDSLVRAQFSVLRWTIARAVDDGQLSAGIGLSVFALDVTTRDEFLTRSGTLFTTRGVAFDSGLVWRPNNLPFRMGLAVRAPVSTEVDAAGTETHGDMVLGSPNDPNAIWMPGSVRRSWSIHGGVAVHLLGPRPMNPRWIDRGELEAESEQYVEARRACRVQRRWQQLQLARTTGGDVEAVERTCSAIDLAHDEDDRRWLATQRQRAAMVLRTRRSAMSRRYLLAALSVQADGPVRDAVGIESFLNGVVNRTGERVTLSPRIGLEAEPLAGWLQIRAGSYLEPARFRSAKPRLHGTAGLDTKLFGWTVFGVLDPETQWRLGAAVDVATQYFSWGVTAGLWH